MTDEKKPKRAKKSAEPEAEEGILVSTAKAVGTVVGKVAALAGATEVAPKPVHPKKVKPQKLQKKNKARLPRKEKKARQKAAAAHSEGRGRDL
jgi:NADPH-dependent curcumin reductase CurA